MQEEGRRRVIFNTYVHLWDQYRFLLPSSWLVDVSRAGRIATVVLDVSPATWAPPPASFLWDDARRVSFSRPLWEYLFSLLIPLPWVRRVDYLERSVVVTLDPRPLPVNGSDHVCVCQSLALLSDAAGGSVSLVEM